MVTKPAQKTVTNNDLMDIMQDMMQMTSDGFLELNGRMDSLEGRMDRLEGRVDGVEGRLDRIENELTAIKSKLVQHDLQFIDLRRIVQDLVDKHSAFINDIADLLDRVAVLEKQMPHVTKEEVYELQQLLQKLVDWALQAAKTVKVPLKLP